MLLSLVAPHAWMHLQVGVNNSDGVNIDRDVAKLVGASALMCRYGFKLLESID
jgi:hypothetical protein